MSKEVQSQLQQLWADVAIEELIRCGVSYFCVAPGSRSTPLALAVAQNPKATSMVHFDERGLAFHAVGYAATQKSGVAIITTSGTAVANLLPAVIEASKRKIPLVILTADRPVELRQTGANQTITQPHIFGTYVRWECDMGVADPHVDIRYIMTTIDQAVYRTQGELPGPVHINWMFREPFAKTFTKSCLNSTYRKIHAAWERSSQPHTIYKKGSATISADIVEEVADKLNKCKRGVIVCGKLPSALAVKRVAELAKKLGWPIFADITSGLRSGSSRLEVIHNFQHLLKYVTEKPELIIQFGGRVTAKAYYEWLESINLEQFIMVLNHPLRNDPLHNVSYRIQTCPGQLAQRLLPKVHSRKNRSYLKSWVQANQIVEQVIEDLSRIDNELSEPLVARTVSQNLSKSHALFLSSSLPIRMYDAFSVADAPAIPVGANRGASGIDGIVASASGFSVGHSKAVTLVIGDLALLYDLNSLCMVANLNKSMTIVVVNNDGGGIFEYLPVSKQKKHFEQFFATPHGYHFESVAQQFGIEYIRVKSAAALSQAYRASLRSKCSTLIEVVCDRKNNINFNENLSKMIQRKLRNKRKG